ATSTAIRPARASSPTAIPGPSTRKCWRRAAHWCARSTWRRKACEEGRRMRPKLLLIDNYDSFTYNLVQAFLVLGAEVRVHRNDAITPDEARGLGPTHLCISPGP